MFVFPVGGTPEIWKPFHDPPARRGLPLENDTGACHPVATAGRHPHQLVPLFTEQGELESGPPPADASVNLKAAESGCAARFSSARHYYADTVAKRSARRANAAHLCDAQTGKLALPRPSRQLCVRFQMFASRALSAPVLPSLLKWSSNPGPIARARPDWRRPVRVPEVQAWSATAVRRQTP